MSLIIEALNHEARREPLALIGPHGTFTYEALKSEVETLARSLRALQVVRLGVCADNTPAWVIIDLACIQAGVTLLPLPAFFSPGQIEYVLETAAIDHLIVPRSLPAKFGKQNAAPVSWKIANELFDGICLATRRRKGDEVNAKITFTSGTTGQPKGVCLSAPVQEAVAASIATVLSRLELRRHLAVLPLATLLENLAGVYVPLLLGATVHLVPLNDLGYSGSSGLDAARLIAVIQCARPESMIVVPALLQALITAAESGVALPDSLRFIAVGGGRVAVSLIERARAAGLPVYEGYGLSECASVVSLNVPGSDRAGSVGRPLPHARVTIAADGEIFVHGPHYAGYLGGDDVPAEIPIATGDVGHLDADGFLHITGRKKDIFITAFGRNVSPEWVEAELTAEPAIAQAAVFGEALMNNIAVLVSNARDVIVDAAVRRANERLPDYARVARWLRADVPFAVANHQLTPNGRLRRAVIGKAYEQSILNLHLS